ncbi:TonB-dependent receptor [Sphingobium sp. ZW T5_29]|uniref:TonB-dependent receptor n=1 Tax=Sphingobium sp. ZW T5_29 TaxID=3378077 RepID=UPI0038548582
MKNKALAFLGMLLTSVAPMPLLAQTAAAPQDGEAQPRPTMGLEEIVVTAQRRSQNLQDVPVAVTAFTGETLENKGIVRVADIQQADSSLFVSQMSGVVIPFLRGVGNPGASTPGNEASVPVYIDDVYYSRLASAYLELANIERVEVLKGPQGTLFGRNSTGGLMQVFTRDPGDTTDLSATIGYANYDTISGKLYAATPISDRVSAGISVSGLNQRNGWGENLFTGKDTYRRKFYNIRSKIVMEPTDTTTIRLSGFYAYQRQNQGNSVSIYPGTTRGYPLGSPLEGTQFFQPSGFYDIYANTEIFHRLRGGGAALKIDQELGFANFVSITSYRKAKELLNYEGDHTELNWLTFPIRIKDRQITQELQLKSKPTSDISWLLGFFYINSRTNVDTRIFGDALTLNGLASQNILSQQTIESWSPFAQATFPVVDEKTNVTLGLRYTKDRVEGKGRQTLTPLVGANFPVAPDYNQTVNFDKWTYKVSLDHNFTDDIMAYATWSRGYKSGTFNTIPLSAPPTNPETVTSYEAGLKLTLFDRRVRANFAVFRNDIKDPQVQLVELVNTPAGPTPFVAFANAEKARTKGVEFDGSILVTRQLRLDLSGQYLSAKFIKFANAPINVPIFAPPWGVTLQSGDASGNRLSQTPKWKINAGFNYELPTSVGEFSLAGQMSYRSNLKWDPDNILTEPKLTLFSASVTFKPEFNDKLTFRLWGTNLSNEKYFNNQIPQTNTPAGDLGGVGDPRAYGVELRFDL